MQRRLSELRDSAQPLERFFAGNIVAELMSHESRFLDRQVDEISFAGDGAQTTSSTFYIRWDHLHKVGKNLPATGMPFNINIDCPPITIQSKVLHHNIQISAGSKILDLVSRRENARLAAAHLVYEACSLGLPIPGLPIISDIGSMVGQFPKHLRARSFDERAAALVASMPDALSRIWCESALANTPGWSRLLSRYHENFLLCPRIKMPKDDLGPLTLNTETRIQGTGSRGFRTLLRNVPPGRQILAININNVGHARSHYVHILAPQGLFIGSAEILRLPATQQLPATRYAASRSQWTYYFRRRSFEKSRSITVKATMFPRPDGFARPLTLLGQYCFGITILMLLAIGPIRQGDFDIGSGMAMLLFVPAVLTSWVFRSDDSRSRGDLLQEARQRAGVLLFVLLVAVAFFSFINSSPLALPVELQSTALVVLILVAGVTLLNSLVHIQEILDAHDQVEELEYGPAKGSSKPFFGQGS